MNIENLNWKIKKEVKTKDMTVPDHVFFGLTLGIIKGPLSDLPKI